MDVDAVNECIAQLSDWDVGQIVLPLCSDKDSEAESINFVDVVRNTLPRFNRPPSQVRDENGLIATKMQGFHCSFYFPTLSRTRCCGSLAVSQETLKNLDRLLGVY